MIDLILIGGMSLLFSISLFFIKRDKLSQIFSYNYLVIGFVPLFCGIRLLNGKEEEMVFFTSSFILLQIFIFLFYSFGTKNGE